MTPNPYAPPKQADRPSTGSWRAVWKRICLGSVCSTVIFELISYYYDTSINDATTGDLFIITRGLLAFGVLVSSVMIGVGGIGWILSRRPPSIVASGAES
jgi:hypothetical protein